MISNLKQQHHDHQYKIVMALANKNEYPHQVYLPKIKVHETHISWIFLFRAKNETDNQKRKWFEEESKDFFELAESYL